MLLLQEWQHEKRRYLVALLTGKGFLIFGVIFNEIVGKFPGLLSQVR